MYVYMLKNKYEFLKLFLFNVLFFQCTELFIHTINHKIIYIPYIWVVHTSHTSIMASVSTIEASTSLCAGNRYSGKSILNHSCSLKITQVPTLYFEFNQIYSGIPIYCTRSKCINVLSKCINRLTFLSQYTGLPLKRHSLEDTTLERTQILGKR